MGNFGDGRINAFNLTTGASLGALQDSTGTPIAISGLWGLLFGSGTKSDGNTLYFVAGIPNGSAVPRGLLGSIAPPFSGEDGGSERGQLAAGSGGARAK